MDHLDGICSIQTTFGIKFKKSSWVQKKIPFATELYSKYFDIFRGWFSSEFSKFFWKTFINGNNLAISCVLDDGQSPSPPLQNYSTDADSHGHIIIRSAMNWKKEDRRPKQQLTHFFYLAWDRWQIIPMAILRAFILHGHQIGKLESFFTQTMLSKHTDLHLKMLLIP